jgi:hypothetical protein
LGPGAGKGTGAENAFPDPSTDLFHIEILWYRMPFPMAAYQT